MRRRGPDGSGHARFRTPAGREVALLNTRLAILDLDPRAAQPFRVGGRHITYNGELYNYRELRGELEREGWGFRTTSDTEVALTAVAAWGWEALDRFEGMWALAVYDEADGSLTLSRDRFGEKPLFLARQGGGLVFGSEVKHVQALLEQPLRPDLEHVRRYLVNGYKALYKGAATFFEGLSELPPGTTLHIAADGSERLERYWRLAPRPDDAMGFDEAVAGTRERLVRAVALRLRADVPLAFCLSGGVDSTALAAVARRECGFDVHGFTVVMDDERYDERDAVARTVQELGIRHTEVPVHSGAFLPELRELVRYHDAPVYTITYFAHWRLLRAVAAGGYEVSVSGTAADELYSGYYDHHLLYLAAVRGDAPRHAAALAAWEREVRPLVRNPYLSDPELFVRDPGFRDHIFLDADGYAAALHGGRRPEPFAEERYGGDLLRDRMLNELLHEVVPPLLHEDDLNAMYWSVENRSPFLDRELAEFAYTIPTRHLVRDGRAKAVLREAVRGIAPAHVLDSPRKVGFNAPIETLLDAADPAVRAEALADGPIWEIVRRDAVEALLDRRAHDNADSKFLFYVLSAKLFLEECGA